MNTNNASTLPKGCGLMLMPMKDVYQKMSEDATKALHFLTVAQTSRQIRNVLQQIQNYQVDSRVSDSIKNIIVNLKGNVRAMRTNDYTRSQMCDDLAKLITVLADAVANEEHQENVNVVRSMFLVLAEHADEITRWLEEKGL